MQTQEAAPAPTSESGVTAKGRYSTLERFRQPYLQRAWDCAEITIPSLLPRDGQTADSELRIPWQSFGARGVNMLAAKFLLALFPPNTPFFKMEIDEIEVKKAQAEMGNNQAQNLVTRLKKALSTFERAVMAEVSMSGDRGPLFQAMRHLIVTGNCLLWHSPKGLRVYRLDKYVVRRDPSGNVMEIVTKESVDPLTLPQELQAIVKEKEPTRQDGTPVDLYMRVDRKANQWLVYQEICGVKVPGSESQYPLDKLPFQPLRWTQMDGESYGRSYVDDQLGDLRSYEALRQAMVEGTSAAARVLFLVKPNGTTKARVLSEAPNGSIREGNAEDVTVLRLDKAQDFQVAKNLESEIKGDLSFAFLMNSAVQRDAERVTAEEVRYMAEELETALGGYYTVMAGELQLPYVTMKIHRLTKSGKLPSLPKGVVNPVIVTGLEALGRGNDKRKLLAWLNGLMQAFGPETVSQRVKFNEFADRIAAADGIDTEGLLITDEELRAQADEAKQDNMQQTMTPELVKAGTKVLTEGMKAGGK